MAFTDLLKKAFPFLSIAASMVPGGNIAATALGQILKLKDGATLNDAGAALINATPEQRLLLEQEENRHQETMRQMGIASAEQFEQIAAADRASAREREKVVKDRTPKILAAVVIAATIFVESYCAWAVFHHQSFDESGAIIIGRILGMLDTSVGLVLAYYFGSSSGSAAKTELLAQQSQQNGKP